MKWFLLISMKQITLLCLIVMPMALAVQSDVTAPADQSGPCPSGPSGPPGCEFGDETYQNGDCIRDTSMVLQCTNGAWRYTAERNCNTTPSPEGCMFNGTTYPNGHILDVTCLVYECVNGDWNFVKNQSDCGVCEAWGDPWIKTFDFHYDGIIGPDTNIYHFSGQGYYCMTQPGTTQYPSYGVCAQFDYCYPNLTSTRVTRAVYVEDYADLTVALTIPNAGAITVLCLDSLQTIGSVQKCCGQSPFTSTCVWIFTDSMCTTIVGNKGLSVRLCKNSHLYIWAMPKLEQNPSELYGLCDTYTGEVQDGYTMHNGTETDDITSFTSSWKLPCTCFYSQRNGGCFITVPADPGYACQCTLVPSANPYCYGTAVKPCLPLSSDLCVHPDISYWSCKKAVTGNCDGYP